jgi:hypothetical protein
MLSVTPLKVSGPTLAGEEADPELPDFVSLLVQAASALLAAIPASPAAARNPRRLMPELPTDATWVMRSFSVMSAPFVTWSLGLGCGAVATRQPLR